MNIFRKFGCYLRTMLFSISQKCVQLLRVPQITKPKLRLKSHFTVCVEGNIGCGKTTLLNYFSHKKDVQVFHEPLNKWRNMKSYNLLDLMYKEPLRWSFLFQTYVQLTMVEQHLKPCSKNIKMMERSLFSARHCFVENHYNSNGISDLEYKVYLEWFDFLMKTMDISVDLIVYLRTDPVTLHERIMERNRPEENKMSLDYLQNLHSLHEKWIFNDSTIPILVIDADQPLHMMPQIYEQYSDQILFGSSLHSAMPAIPS